MSDEEVAKFTLKVSVEDSAKSVDLNTYLEKIADIKVRQDFKHLFKTAHPTLLYVVPEGRYDAGKLFTAIEGMTEQWFNSRRDAVTVEIHKPDGRLQVLVREKECSNHALSTSSEA
jgi:hypothetical protein